MSGKATETNAELRNTTETSHYVGKVYRRQVRLH